MSSERSFGQWLKQRRKALDLTQEELALRVGCSIVMIQKIESGERRPSKQIADLLAKQLEIDPEEHVAFTRFARARHALFECANPAPWRSAYRHLTNLPAPPSSLIGREREMEALSRQLADKRVRLVTLVGPPGIGKTRLGIQAAIELLDEFESGIYFVNLAPIRDCSLFMPTLAQVLGIQNGRRQSLFSEVQEFLADKQMLLLLDNFEQVIAAAPLVAELVNYCPWLKVLATSRIPLHLRAEQQFPVPPLALPRSLASTDDPSLAQYSSIAMFLDRARAVQPDFELTRENASPIVEICARLDALPLAIELVAARATHIPLPAIRAQLEHRLELLIGGPTDLPPRHQTLRDAIAWSYDLLDEQEQLLLARLSVFIGSLTLDAAEQVCGRMGQEKSSQALYPLLCALADKSLLKKEKSEEGRHRFSMLETIREYALERLTERGELASAQRHHADYFLSQAELAEPQLTGPEQVRWLERLEGEQDNLRAALEWALGQNDYETALRLCGALWRFWQLRGDLGEGLTWARAVLSLRAPRLEIEPERLARHTAKACLGAGHLAWDAGCFAEARSFFEKSARLCERLQDKAGLARALYGLGKAEFPLSHYQQTDLLFAKSLALFRELGDQRGIAMILLQVGRLATAQGDYERAGACLAESLELHQERRETYGQALALTNLGELALARGDFEQATRNLTDSHARLKELGEKQMTMWVIARLGEIAWQQGNPEQAERLLDESLQISRERKDRWHTAYALTKLGLVLLAKGDVTRAEALCQDGLTCMRELGSEEDIALATKELARVKLWQHHPAEASSLYRSSLLVFRRLNYRPDIAECLEGLGTLAVLKEDWETSVRLSSAARALRDRLGAPMPPVLLSGYQDSLEAACARLGDKEFRRIWDAAQALTLEEATAWALEELA